MNQADMTQKIRSGDGFIAALDQSGGSTPKALQGYGYQGDEWSNDEEMFGLIHKMRTRIITSPAFATGKVIGAILFERTMDGQVDGKPVPQALIDRGIVPFIKIDKGLEDEANGVQMMKPNPGLDTLLERARGLGVFGTKERSVINAANPAGIAVLLAQQFQVAKQVLGHGLIPIVEPEVNIKSVDRNESDHLLLAGLLAELDGIPDGQQVMLKLSLPAEAGLFEPGAYRGKMLQSATVHSDGTIDFVFDARSGREGGVVRLVPDLSHPAMGVQWDCESADYPSIAQLLPDCRYTGQ